jgi:hypothetical protein
MREETPAHAAPGALAADALPERAEESVVVQLRHCPEL